MQRLISERNSLIIQRAEAQRLSNVWENPGGLNYQTSYTNGANDTLQTVTKGGETRSFYYDSLGRLTGSTQPETGTINYTYYNVGNMLTRTDARSVTSTYSYDALNRVKSIGYNDGKTYTASFSYDGSGGTATGHLTSVSNSDRPGTIGSPHSEWCNTRRAEARNPKTALGRQMLPIV